MSNASTLRERAALASQLAAKLEEAAAIEEQLGTATATATAVTPAKAKKPRAAKKASATSQSSTTAQSTESTSGGTGSGRGRRNGPKSMKEMVVSVLKGKKQGLTLSDIVQAVIDGGYETKSKNPVNVVYQAVYKLMKDEDTPEDQRIEKTEENSYRLKAAA